MAHLVTTRLISAVNPSVKAAFPEHDTRVALLLPQLLVLLFGG